MKHQKLSLGTLPGRGRTGVLALVLVVAVSGCSGEPVFRMNSVHMLTIEKTMFEPGESITAENRQDIADVMTAMFGTPNDPWFPDFIPEDDALSQVVSADLLSHAAGPVASDRQGRQRGLYREHCAHCHGITGDGAGPTAAFLNPYPRDFRLGKFKFKKTKLGQPPTHGDLARVLQNGIPGTAMPSFKLLEEEEIEALVNYVKYLSIRGQVERRLIEELPNLDDAPLISSAADDDQIKEQMAIIIEDILLPVLEKWSNAKPTPVPDVNRAFYDSQEALSILGRELFYEKGNCAQCHGETGLGDGQTENYDDWTNEWLKRANVNPAIPQEVAEFIDAGAFPPRKLRPRNLRHRVFRGGNQLDDIYRRIANGIEGSSMPASGSTLSNEEIWSLVAYVLDLPYLKLTDE